MSLNQDQSLAYEQFKAWLLTGEPHFILEGPAGAGKGYLLQYIAESKPDLDMWCKVVTDTECPSFHFTATTNEAVNSLNVTNANTIYGAAGIRPQAGKLIGWRQPEKDYQAIVIVDEASYIDEEAFQLITKQLPSCRFVWCLDEHQLPPVGSSTPYIPSLNCIKASLNKVERNQGPLQKMSLDLRNNVATKTMTHIPSYHNGDDIIVLSDLKQFRTMMKEEYLKYGDTVFLAYNNNVVDAYNRAINDKVLGKPEFPYPGAKCVASRFTKNSNSGATVYISSVYDEDISLSDADGNMHTSAGKRIVTNCGDFYFTDGEGIPAKLLKKHMALNPINALTLSYCMTVHKSQGRTVDTVFVDATNIGSCWDKELVRRLLYVAVSRAAKKVIIYAGE